MRDYERKAIADAAYDAWRDSKDYDNAWDRAEDAVSQYGPCSYYEAEDAIAQYEHSYQRHMARTREESRDDHD